MRKWIFGTVAAALVGGTALPAAARTQVDFFVNVAPPPVYREYVPAPRSGYVWVPGYWDWGRGHRVWVAGHWVRPRYGYYHEPARWHYRHGRHYDRPAGWRDYDGDGVPNRYDRAPRNPRWH